jgi:hypothetical protein
VSLYGRLRRWADDLKPTRTGSYTYEQLEKILGPGTIIKMGGCRDRTGLREVVELQPSGYYCNNRGENDLYLPPTLINCPDVIAWKLTPGIEDGKVEFFKDSIVTKNSLKKYPDHLPLR